MAKEAEPPEPPWQTIVEQVRQRLDEWEDDYAPEASLRCVEALDALLAGYEKQWRAWSESGGRPDDQP